MLKNTPKNKTKKKNQLNSYVKYSSLAIQMAIIIVVGYKVGEYLDSTNNSKPVFIIIFSLCSVFYSIYYMLKKTIRNNEKK